jgi:hypothetical protein
MGNIGILYKLFRLKDTHDNAQIQESPPHGRYHHRDRRCIREARDPRKHTITTVYVAAGAGTPEAQDDAQELEILDPEKIDRPLAFDHRRILDDYLERRNG